MKDLKIHNSARSGGSAAEKSGFGYGGCFKTAYQRENSERSGIYNHFEPQFGAQGTMLGADIAAMESFCHEQFTLKLGLGL